MRRLHEFQGCRILGCSGPMYLKILEAKVTMTNHDKLYILGLNTKSNRSVAKIAKGSQKNHGLRMDFVVDSSSVSRPS